ncbi:MAG: preprotein translocase subunit SecG [Candidatus Firestonebacteria bacterium]|nr:preprotein translocase subunit SecG [Candidatus Firestonebacteria bacterium]
MFTSVTIIHIIISIILVLLILLQSTKSDATAFLGGAASSNLFGGKGPLSFITKITAVLVILFFLTSTFLAISQRSIIQRTTFPEKEAPIENSPFEPSKQIPINTPPINNNNNNVKADSKAEEKKGLAEAETKTGAINKTENNVNPGNKVKQ